MLGAGGRVKALVLTASRFNPDPLPLNPDPQNPQPPTLSVKLSMLLAAWRARRIRDGGPGLADDAGQERPAHRLPGRDRHAPPPKALERRTGCEGQVVGTGCENSHPVLV